MSDKTEEATPKRLRKAREEGDAGVSAYAAQAVGFVVAVAVAPAAVAALAHHAGAELVEVLAGAPRAAASFDGASLATSVLALTLPMLAAVGAASALASFAQSGGVLATGRLALRLNRLNPAAGLRGLVSSTRLFAVARALVAALVVAWLALRGLVDHAADLARVGGRAGWQAVLATEVAGGLAWRVALVGLALGVLDLVVTRTAWRRRLRMGKDEVRREHKESEGDPQVKAARERAFRELLAQATIANVKTASVVVVNPTHLACALRYDEKEGDEAPTVVAAGEGDLAERIKRAAEAYGVPIVHDVPLARALVELQVGAVIPEALYEAVAEILRDLRDHDERERSRSRG